MNMDENMDETCCGNVVQRMDENGLCKRWVHKPILLFVKSGSGFGLWCLETVKLIKHHIQTILLFVKGGSGFGLWFVEKQ